MSLNNKFDLIKKETEDYIKSFKEFTSTGRNRNNVIKNLNSYNPLKRIRSEIKQLQLTISGLEKYDNPSNDEILNELMRINNREGIIIPNYITDKHSFKRLAPYIEDIGSIKDNLKIVYDYFEIKNKIRTSRGFNLSDTKIKTKAGSIIKRICDKNNAGETTNSNLFSAFLQNYYDKFYGKLTTDNKEYENSLYKELETCKNYYDSFPDKMPNYKNIIGTKDHSKFEKILQMGFKRRKTAVICKLKELLFSKDMSDFPDKTKLIPYNLNDSTEKYIGLISHYDIAKVILDTTSNTDKIISTILEHAGEYIVDQLDNPKFIGSENSINNASLRIKNLLNEPSYEGMYDGNTNLKDKINTKINELKILLEKYLSIEKILNRISSNSNESLIKISNSKKQSNIKEINNKYNKMFINNSNKYNIEEQLKKLVSDFKKNVMKLEDVVSKIKKAQQEMIALNKNSNRLLESSPNNVNSQTKLRDQMKIRADKLKVLNELKYDRIDVLKRYISILTNAKSNVLSQISASKTKKNNKPSEPLKYLLNLYNKVLDELNTDISRLAGNNNSRTRGILGNKSKLVLLARFSDSSHFGGKNSIWIPFAKKNILGKTVRLINLFTGRVLNWNNNEDYAKFNGNIIVSYKNINDPWMYAPQPRGKIKNNFLSKSDLESYRALIFTNYREESNVLIGSKGRRKVINWASEKSKCKTKNNKTCVDICNEGDCPNVTTLKEVITSILSVVKSSRKKNTVEEEIMNKLRNNK